MLYTALSDSTLFPPKINRSTISIPYMSLNENRNKDLALQATLPLAKCSVCNIKRSLKEKRHNLRILKSLAQTSQVHIQRIVPQ